MPDAAASPENPPPGEVIAHPLSPDRTMTPPGDARTSHAREWLLRAAIAGGLIALFCFAIRGGLYRPMLQAADSAHWANAILRPSILWMFMGTALLALRTLLWFGYRPQASTDDSSAPSLTVIIPAYNEGAMVAQSIASVINARYPRDRLEIFVIDDGSRDDTWEHIERMAHVHADLVRAVRFDRNRGKRAALEVGFRQARGEIVVTIDSDSVIEPDSLFAITGPFRNSRVGAVAGKVVALNRFEGLIPRMLHVRYVLSFDMLRASQSTYGTVYCCPGALSAYRVSIVREVLDAWVRQRFWGVPCTYGEDRALTNFILERGYDTVYQQSAVVRTTVPTTYWKLCRMFLRWDRSYVREELQFARIVWKRPLHACVLAFCECTITNLRYPVMYASLILFVVLSISDPMTILRMLLIVGTISAFYMLYYFRSERSPAAIYGVLYAYFSLFALWWIFPYALLTVRERSWMTR